MLIIVIYFFIFVEENYSYHIPKPHKFTTTGSKASFLDWPHIWKMIIDVRDRENKEVLRECDYSRITSAILPYYFHVSQHKAWVITPEFNYLEDRYPDYTIFLVENSLDLSIRAVVEIKSKKGKSWHELLEQMWDQADVVSHQDKLWAIGQKGLEICIFRFDVSKFQTQNPECFTNFEPLNLNNLSVPQLDNLNVKYELCNDNGFARIALIKWRLDNKQHIAYIDHMFQYMRSKIIS